MERDFMGLNSLVVKEEVVESSQDSGVRWSSSTVSTPPHFLSLKSAQGEKSDIFVTDRNVPTGFGALSAVDPFNAASKCQPGEIQVPFSASKPSYKTHFGNCDQNFAAGPMKQQFLGGIPVTGPLSVFPSSGSVARTTGPWFNSATPAKLTIFYAGTVNVFDDISPEKALAIMFLAGNGCTTPNVVQPRFQVQASASKPAAVENSFVSRTPNLLPVSGLSIPMSISSHPIAQSGGNSANKDDEDKTSKAATISLNFVGKLEPPKIVRSLGSVGSTIVMPTAIPQARKASLARFLERRKERVMSSTPYNLSKKPCECTTPDSSDVCFSATSNVSTSPMLIGKETNS